MLKHVFVCCMYDVTTVAHVDSMKAEVDMTIESLTKRLLTISRECRLPSTSFYMFDFFLQEVVCARNVPFGASSVHARAHHNGRTRSSFNSAPQFGVAALLR